MKTVTVLVVDADAMHREAIRRILRQAGYRVLEAADYRGAENAHLVNRGQVDLLLTALALPGGTGHDLASAVQSIEPRVKVLFVSGETGAKANEFHSIPWGLFLLRPFEPEELLRRVTSVLTPAGTSTGA